MIGGAPGHTAAVITLGIDLAAQAKKTAVCRLSWEADGSVAIRSLDGGWSDERLLEIARDVDAIGIDAPFGFPQLIRRAISEYAESGRFPARPDEESVEEWSRRLRFRETDRFVNAHLLEHHGLKLWPLSVSSDRIAVAAWRCAHLLTQLSLETGRPLDRVGTGAGVPKPRTVEVYPAAALACWALPYKGYKPGAAGSPRSAGAQARRDDIVDGLCARLGSALELGSGDRADLVGDDDLLDAFVAALVTRAAAKRATVEPRADQRAAAEEEGWIHLPSGPLSELVGG